MAGIGPPLRRRQAKLARSVGESPTQVMLSRQPGSECCVSRRRRRPRSVHSGCVGCVIEPRNGYVAGAETVQRVERNMDRAAKRCHARPGGVEEQITRKRIASERQLSRRSQKDTEPGPGLTCSLTTGFLGRASSTLGPNSDLPSLTRGRSRMRESCTYGSVRGAGSNLHRYRDRNQRPPGTEAIRE
jgi:hypothetical protein